MPQDSHTHAVPSTSDHPVPSASRPTGLTYISIPLIVGHGLDTTLAAAVREGVTVLEDGATGLGHQYRPVEELIEVRAVRTWRLEYTGEETS